VTLTSIPWRVAAAALALAGAAPAAAGQAGRNGPNPPASSYGHLHDELFMLITALTGVSFLIVLFLLMVPVIRDRAAPGKKAHFDHGRSLHDKRFTAIVSITVFVVLDAWVLVVAMTDLREAQWNVPSFEQDQDVVRVQVLAQQWAWNFRQPGADGEFGTPDDIVTLNELTLPASAMPPQSDPHEGRPVVLNLTSKDVIHSFFVPDMRIKRDANPGALNQAWFMPVQAGEYDILCAELCGFAHYEMHGKLHVLEGAAWDAWMAEASIQAAAAFDENDTEAHWAWDWQE
jgi:cytochrome c oxidase subunit 2